MSDTIRRDNRARRQAGKARRARIYRIEETR